jgi:hypothetical protein
MKKLAEMSPGVGTDASGAANSMSTICIACAGLGSSNSRTTNTTQPASATGSSR